MQVLKKLKNNLFLVLVALFLGTTLCAQSKIGVQPPPFKNPVFVSPTFEYLKVPDLELEQSPIMLRTPYLSPHWEPAPFNSPLAGKVLNVLAVLSDANRFGNMPFFCRIEYQAEQAARFPVRFRLGDIQYVDRMESKVDWELGN